MPLAAAGTNILASIPSPPSEFSKFSIGPLTIHAYAICIMLGIVAAMWIASRRWRAKGGPEDVVWDICIWAIPFGIVGGRLYHVLVTDPEYYFGLQGQSAHLSEIPQIWAGGLGIMGAISLGSLGAWIACRRAGVRLSAFLDAAVPGVLLAQAFGRWGNWFNQELFGAPTTLPWGLEIDPNSHNFPPGLPAGTLFHPTFLYESLWNVAGVFLLLALDRKFKLRRGAMFWAYITFSQWLIMWAGNLPEEIQWYLPRVSGGWGVIAVSVVIRIGRRRTWFDTISASCRSMPCSRSVLV